MMTMLVTMLIIMLIIIKLVDYFKQKSYLFTYLLTN